MLELSSVVFAPPAASPPPRAEGPNETESAVEETSEAQDSQTASEGSAGSEGEETVGRSVDAPATSQASSESLFTARVDGPPQPVSDEEIARQNAAALVERARSGAIIEQLENIATQTPQLVGDVAPESGPPLQPDQTPTEGVSRRA